MERRDWVVGLSREEFPDDMSLSALTAEFEPDYNLLALILTGPELDEHVNTKRRCQVVKALKYARNPMIDNCPQHDLTPTTLGDLRTFLQCGKLEGVDGLSGLPGEERSLEILRKLFLG